MYKTGDIGLWTSNGEILYLGRSDNQVKIRGYRIELGEIETQLLRHPAIKEAVVLNCEAKNGNKFLCAYIVSETDIETATLKDYLSKELPYYMMPSNFIRITSIPTTPNGKVDRKVLEGLHTEIYQTQVHTVPTTEIERKLACIWKDVLGVGEVGLEDNFFSLGGNSLTVIKLEVEMERCGMNISASDVFENQTLEELAGFVQNHNTIKQQKKGSTIKNNMNIEGHGTSVHKNNIGNIEPFNEFLYRSCFYNAAFPAVLHLSKGISSILTNDVPVYTYDNKLQLGIDYLAQNTLEDTLNYDGVCVEKKYKVQDIVSRIIEAINCSRPVVIAVDCFYESIRSDMYQKEHWPHYLLVYGYDISQNTFNIIEHVNRDSLTYEKKRITFKEVIEASEGYSKYFKQDDDPILFEFFLAEGSSRFASEPEKSNLLFKGIYANHVYNCQNSIIEGLEKLNLFRTDFESIALSENDLYKNADMLIKGFNDIVNAKKVEFYKASKIYKGEQGIVNLVQSILEHWIYIRSIVVKYLYSKVYNQAQLETCIDKLNLIYDLEHKYHQRIILHNNKV